MASLPAKPLHVQVTVSAWRSRVNETPWEAGPARRGVCRRPKVLKSAPSERAEVVQERPLRNASPPQGGQGGQDRRWRCPRKPAWALHAETSETRPDAL